MESIATLVLKIEAATPKELGEVLEALNREVHSENGWNSISVKAAYVNLLSAVDAEIGNFSTYLAFGNDTMDYEDCSTGEQLTFNVRQALGNLTIAKEFFTNPPVLANPKDVDVNSINWNNREIFTAEETMVILNLGETTYRKWVNDGWLSETQMMGSNKRYVQKKDIMDFLNNPKIRKEAWK
jgi:hypothetical protein